MNTEGSDEKRGEREGQPSKSRSDVERKELMTPTHREDQASDKPQNISADASQKLNESKDTHSDTTASMVRSTQPQQPPLPLTDEQQRVIRLIQLPQSAKQDDHVAGLYDYFNKFDFLKDMQKEKDEKNKQNKGKATQKQQNKKAQEMAKDQKSVE